MITFNGIYLKDYMKVLTTRWSVLPPQKNTLLSIPKRAGSYFIRKEDDITTLEVDIAVIANSINELRSAVRNIASLLYTDAPAPLVLDSEPDKTYYAILDGEPKVDKLGRMGTVTLTFICPDPYAFGNSVNHPIEAIDPTFARTSTAYKSDGSSVASGVARYENGYFAGSKGIFIEDGTTNLFPVANQTFATGWLANAGATPTITQNQAVAEWGATDATRIQTTGGTNAIKYYSYPITAQTSGNYVGQMKVKNNGAVTARVALIINGIGNHYLDVLPGEIKTLYFTLLTGAGATTMGFCFSGYSIADNLDITVWRPQIEYNRGYSSTWHTTTRQADSLIIPNQSDLMNATEGTIVFRFKPDWNAADMNRNAVLFTAFSNGVTNGQYFFNFRAANKTWQLGSTNLQSTTQTFTKGTIVYLALVWTDTQLMLYVNGILVSTVAKPVDFALMTNNVICIGRYTSTGFEANGTIEDFAIFSKAKTDGEILAIANATSPLIPDQYTTYQLKLNNSLIATFNNPMQRSGSAVAKPIFTVTFKASASELKILQNETGKYIRVVKSFVANDVLVIDCNKNLITINGVNSMQYLDLYSDFIELTSGNNTFTITPDNVAVVTINYQERWL